VEDVYFPNWSRLFGWQAFGRRVDRVGGKLAVTVYYSQGQRQIAYTILASPPLKWANSQMLHLDRISLQGFTVSGRTVVTWQRAGHTCVLSGSGVSTSELARLASWEAPGLEG
jgi:hypothetical protein